MSEPLKLLTPNEAAAMLRCSPWTIYRAIQSGRLPAVKFASRPRRGADRQPWRLGRMAGRWATVTELRGLIF